MILHCAGRWSFAGTGASSIADGSADVRAFQNLVLTKAIKHEGSLLLESAIREASVRKDPRGIRRFQKRGQTGGLTLYRLRSWRLVCTRDSEQEGHGENSEAQSSMQLDMAGRKGRKV